jgi:hypothetical protein
VSDPRIDADAHGITFTRAQASWINHHVRNAMVLLSVPQVPGMVERAVDRLEDVCNAAVERLEERR